MDEMNHEDKTNFRIGTRGSKLALWQANWVKNALHQNGFASEIIVIHTSGDQNQQGPIAGIGSQGVFTKEIQRALIAGEIDVAVHSLKDLPTEKVDGLVLAATPKRGPHADAFVSTKASHLDKLPDRSKIGTGSARRKAQIVNRFGDRFQILDIRGNVETRLKKLYDGEYDALILAEAGLVRLELSDHVTSRLEKPFFLSSVGQGILGLETRESDVPAQKIVQTINDPETFAAANAERSLLATLRGGCLAPIAAFAEVENNLLTLHARVFSQDGRQMIEAKQNGNVEKPCDLGVVVAEELFSLGAESLLRA